MFIQTFNYISFIFLPYKKNHYSKYDVTHVHTFNKLEYICFYVGAPPTYVFKRKTFAPT